MSDTYKPVTKYVTLKITYNSYYVESPDSWDWNQLADCADGENIELISINSTCPYAGENA